MKTVTDHLPKTHVLVYRPRTDRISILTDHIPTTLPTTLPTTYRPRYRPHTDCLYRPHTDSSACFILPFFSYFHLIRAMTSNLSCLFSTSRRLVAASHRFIFRWKYRRMSSFFFSTPFVVQISLSASICHTEYVRGRGRGDVWPKGMIFLSEKN